MPSSPALVRARKIVAEKVPSRTQQQTLRDIDDARLREIVARYSAALERGDADALVTLLTEDVTWSMPPLAHWYHGLHGRAVLVQGQIALVPDVRLEADLPWLPRRRWKPSGGDAVNDARADVVKLAEGDCCFGDGVLLMPMLAVGNGDRCHCDNPGYTLPLSSVIK